MTVKELIEELKKYPENLEVLYSDYEYGNTEINQVEPEKEYNYQTKQTDNIILLK